MKDTISRHCSCLAQSLHKGLAALKYPNGTPVVEIYVEDATKIGDALAQGPTLAFNVLRQDGSYAPWPDVERMANDAGVYIRAGGKLIRMITGVGQSMTVT